MKDNKKKYLIVSIVIAIVAVVAIIFSSTYAYWQLTRKTSPDDVVAMCLDLTIENETGTFGLEKAWPISDEEGKLLEGLTFTIKNNCEKAVNYIVGLNSVQTESNNNYMDNDSVKVMLDDHSPLLYADLGKIEYANPDDIAVIRESRQLSVETIEGGATNTHNVKAWIDMNADVSNQGKTFSGKIFITGGMGIYSGDHCYKIASNGTIWGYDENCNMNINVPAEISGIAVKTINKASFTNADLYITRLENVHVNTEIIAVVHLQDENHEQIEQIILEQVCSDYENCEASNLSDFATVYDSYEEFAAVNTTNYTVEYSEAYKYNVSKNILEDAGNNVTSLNLSDAIYLEKIEESSFYGRKDAKSNLCVGKEILTSNKEDYCETGVLESLILPQNGALTTIEESAFAHNKLKSVLLPDTVTIIGQSAFVNNNLTNVKLSNRLEVIPNYLFSGNKIEKVIIPEGIKDIGDYAFQNNMISELKIPASVERIGNYAFSVPYDRSENEPTITKLVLENTEEKPSQLKTIADGAFAYNSIRELILPNSLETIGRFSFYSNNISNLVVPATVTSIGEQAFESNNMTSVIFEDTPEHPSQLNYLAGFGNNNLTTVKIPGNVVTIGVGAFNGNELKGIIVIPKKVTTIDEFAFYGFDIDEIIILRTEEDANANMTFGSKWSYRTKVTYNPNYIEQ